MRLVWAVTAWTVLCTSRNEAAEAPVAQPGRPPLIIAVERNQRDAVERLLKAGAELEGRTPDGVTPLYAAAFQGHAEMVRLLVAAGAKVDGRAANNRTALFPAAAEGHLAAVEALLECGADPEARSDAGDLAQTPLHMAALEGKTEIVERLLERGARINVRSDPHQITPLYLAVLAGHEKTAALFLARGADPALADVFGQTPLRAAAVMAERKKRELTSVADHRLGFDPSAIVVLPYIEESYARRSYRGIRLGVAFGDGTLIATAAHCIDDFLEADQQAILARPLVFSAYYGDVFNAEIIAVDSAADVAILRVSWKGHPALQLAGDEELKNAKEVLVAGYPPPEEKDAIRRVVRQVRAERLPVLENRSSKAPHQIVMGGARFIGPGWSGSPMILPESGKLAGIFTRKDDLKLDDLLVYQNRSGASVQAIRELMSAEGIRMGDAPEKWEGRGDAAEAFSAALDWLDAQTGRPPRERLAASEALVQKRPQSGMARWLLAFSASGLSRSAGGDAAAGKLAETQYQEAARLAPDSVLAQASYALHLDMAGRPEEALNELEKAARLAPANSFVRAARLKILTDLRPEEAVEVGRRLATEVPDNAAYWFHYAGALRKLERNEEALEAARSAVRLVPKEQIEYHGRLADLLSKCGHLDEAEARYRELLEQRPGSPVFWMWYTRFLIERRPERVADRQMALEKCEALNKPPVIPASVLRELRARATQATTVTDAQAAK